MKNLVHFLFVIALTFFEQLVFAENLPIPERKDWDVHFKLGGTAGKAIQGANSDSDEEEFGYGGSPIVVGLNFELSPSFTLTGEIGIVFEKGETAQINRTGIHGQLAYHLLGGCRKIVRDYGPIAVYDQNPYNLSLLGTAALAKFGATDKTGTASYNGSVFELLGGLQYRFDVSESGAVQLDFLYTLMSFPASTERLTVKRFDITVGYRFYL